MTSIYNIQKQKHIVKISIPRPYTSIKAPYVKIVGEYDTFAEAKVASEAAVLVRNEVLKLYKEQQDTTHKKQNLSTETLHHLSF